MAETKKEVVTEEKVTEKPKTKKASSKKSETAKEAKKAPSKRAASKKAPAAKKETKAEVKEVKPTVTEAKAKVLGLKVTPRKVRLVLDLVRGKNVDEAIETLSLVHKEAAPMIIKLINSAVANATNNFNMNKDKLYIHEIMASDSFKMRRYLPRAKGSASGMVKRFSNVYITLKEKNEF